MGKRSNSGTLPTIRPTKFATRTAGSGLPKRTGRGDPELRDPEADNALPGALSASDESQRVRNGGITPTGVSPNPALLGPDNQWREFVLGSWRKAKSCSTTSPWSRIRTAQPPNLSAMEHLRVATSIPGGLWATTAMPRSFPTRLAGGTTSSICVQPDQPNTCITTSKPP